MKNARSARSSGYFNCCIPNQTKTPTIATRNLSRAIGIQKKGKQSEDSTDTVQKNNGVPRARPRSSKTYMMDVPAITDEHGLPLKRRIIVTAVSMTGNPNATIGTATAKAVELF